ncbi:response regulator [Mucilaginibacter myungsuensis]|uniref:Response regulator n=1 Tax=Mucilaginibacter myungsuensis TaxID=649104 RepID=A0A929KYX4_9SPHI|nr:response regulator [Mucilaginibacter myungsuensis]MBE9663197.1 response regulator [Mucilaginibacter myungsuensis]MDN3598832.1 response regulator [Mucilaginibacter myungsuensis]
MKKKVLLLEDDNLIRDVVSLILGEEGYEVLAAEPTPIERFKNLRPHVILLDEWINQQQGDQLCHELKKIHALLHVPVIIFSTAVNIAEIAKDCKADGYVRKPFMVEELLQEIEKCMSGTAHASASAAG